MLEAAKLPSVCHFGLVEQFANIVEETADLAICFAHG